jgi:hypothetical protein
VKSRPFFYNPLLIFVNIVIVIKSIVSVLTPEENGKLLIIGQYRAREAHQISILMQITGFGGLTFERVDYSKHSIL